MEYSRRSFLFTLAVVLAISIPAVSATAATAADTKSWYDWYDYGWQQTHSYKDWSYAVKPPTTTGSDLTPWSWDWGNWGNWNWGDWGNWGDWKTTYDGSCGWWWWGTCASASEAHYATVSGKVKDDKGRPVKGAQLKVSCYHRVWDSKLKLWGPDTAFYNDFCYTNALGTYSYAKVPTKEYSYQKWGSHFSYCQVRPAKLPAKYTYLSVDKKDYKCGYWNAAKVWKYDCSDNQKLSGPTYTYTSW